jgi:hypothetical protein
MDANRAKVPPGTDESLVHAVKGEEVAVSAGPHVFASAGAAIDTDERGWTA